MMICDVYSLCFEGGFQWLCCREPWAMVSWPFLWCVEIHRAVVKAMSNGHRYTPWAEIVEVIQPPVIWHQKILEVIFEGELCVCVFGCVFIFFNGGWWLLLVLVVVLGPSFLYGCERCKTITSYRRLGWLQAGRCLARGHDKMCSIVHEWNLQH